MPNCAGASLRTGPVSQTPHRRERRRACLPSVAHGQEISGYWMNTQVAVRRGVGEECRPNQAFGCGAETDRTTTAPPAWYCSYSPATRPVMMRITHLSPRAALLLTGESRGCSRQLEKESCVPWTSFGGSDGTPGRGDPASARDGCKQEMARDGKRWGQSFVMVLLHRARPSTTRPA